MKNEKMLHAIGQIDDDMIEDAVIQTNQKKQPVYKAPAFRRAVAIAACFALIIGLALSAPTWFNSNIDGPGVPVEPGVPIDPGKLPPPSVEEDGRIHIGGLDEFSYYAALRMIAGTPTATNQNMFGGNYGISLLGNGSGADKEEAPPEPETTGPEEETQGPPVSTTPTPPAGYDEDIFYYALDPNEPFFINKVSFFKILLTDENGFLASQLGLGVVDVVITEDCIWGDSLITFRKGDKFFSCLSNGWHSNRDTGGWQWDFSTHKYVEGFYIVKNFEQENHAFYIDMDAAGQAVAFQCQGAQNGGYRPDQNVQIVSSTEISNESRSFTVAELEEYFNSGKLPEDETPPAQPATNLEFWIAENVDTVDFSKLQEKYGMFGGREYYGTGYVPTVDENGQQVDPEHCVIYTVTSYPDYSDKEQHITGIYITDPNVEFYGITLQSSIQEFMALIKQQGFDITEHSDSFVKAKMGKIWVTFTAECIRIGVEVTNNQGIIF